MRIFLRFCNFTAVNQNERAHALQVGNKAHVEKQRENAHLNAER